MEALFPVSASCSLVPNNAHRQLGQAGVEGKARAGVGLWGPTWGNVKPAGPDGR